MEHHEKNKLITIIGTDLENNDIPYHHNSMMMGEDLFDEEYVPKMITIGRNFR